MAEKPTSSSTMYTTFGAPSGAFGGSNGDQSGTESRISTLIVPLNGWLTVLSLPEVPDPPVPRRAALGHPGGAGGQRQAQGHHQLRGRRHDPGQADLRRDGAQDSHQFFRRGAGINRVPDLPQVGGRGGIEGNERGDLDQGEGARIQAAS